ncbi:MAG TPA: hypothetical protein VKB38_18075 [Terracidiphilus sp.]|nr:hypothetical protein [Terracidiphilus sp.]
MPSGSFNAGLTTTPPLTVGQFYSNPPAPAGSIGVCLSGGGSRALTAGMGQLQALSYLTLNGTSLLGQIKALSTVSGGSWLGVPYEFLQTGSPADAAFLGTFNPNIGSETLQQLGILAPTSAAAPVTNWVFSPVFLALQAVILYEIGVPTNMLWQTIIGMNILQPAGLFQFGANLQPTDMFSNDSNTLKADVTGPNPSLAGETAYLVASGSSRTPRPFLACNMAMLVNEPGTKVKSFAPVQATPFITGIVGTPKGTDQNGLTPGGGGVTSFAFNSTLQSVSGSQVSVGQTRQWSLTDIAGTSSSFFAGVLQNQIQQWEDNPLQFIWDMAQYIQDIYNWIYSHLFGTSRMQAKAFVARTETAPTIASAAAWSFPNPQDLIPQYNYWPVLNPKAVTNPQATGFADGGYLENCGINAMLAYDDIKALISFTNSQQALVRGAYGISDGKGGYLPNTNIVVDDAIPPLFGYQPYGNGDINECNKGYVLYAGATCVDSLAQGYANNQVFASDQFPALLQGLWAAANNGGTNAGPAIFQQTLSVMPNSWFGIPANKEPVTILWCYLNYLQPFVDQFANNPEVAGFIQNDITQYNFPNYLTMNTDLTATQVNLMSSLAAWAVVLEDQNNSTFTKLFQQYGPAAAVEAEAAAAV